MSFSNFKITRYTLCQLMKARGQEGLEKLNLHGGIDGLCMKLITSPTDGIAANQFNLAERRKVFGSNYIPPPRQKSLFRLIVKALQDTTLLILLVSAFISLMLSLYQMIEDDIDTNEAKYSWIEGVAIIATVAVIVLVTAVNDYSKERQFRNLKKRLESERLFAVMRNGVVLQINVAEIVVGDICLVKYGDILPADGVVVQSSDLKVDESNLTGESQLLVKSIERDPLLFSGTQVMEGSGKMLVAAVGINSQEGMIFALFSTNKKEKISKRSSSQESVIANGQHSILQTKLNKLVICLSYVGFAVGVVTIIILITRFCVKTFVIDKKSWKTVYLITFMRYVIIGITILVVSIPEGLPLAVTLALAYSVRKMMSDHNLVRHLDACETMGNATTICSDKTGTLTTNRMTVVQSFICEYLYKEKVVPTDIPQHVLELIVTGISVNTASTSDLRYGDDGQSKQIGNKTECALLGFVRALGEDYNEIRETHKNRIAKVFTFNSLRKSMSTIISLEDGYRVYTKGASEEVLKKCSYIYSQNGEIKLINNDVRKVVQQSVIETMCAEGLRTIMLAYKDLLKTPYEINHRVLDESVGWDEEYICSQLTFLGIFGIEDPVRPDVPKAIQKCQRAGITVRMVTGDNITTAHAIAVKCGILGRNDNWLVLDSKQFNERITDNLGLKQQYLLDKVWPSLRVLARSSPLDKYVLVKGIINSRLTRHREVVAVTGDGTNDGPALKMADVGFAMGLAGTDVAKEASDIILTDDNFSNIVKAVMWGRNVYDNISKFIQFQLTVNVVAIVVEFIGACTVQDSPLKAVQMLWINLIMDSLAALALATETPTEELLARKPYGRTRRLITNFMLFTIFGQAIYQLAVLICLLFMCNIGMQTKNVCKSTTLHYTIIFNTLVMMTLFNEINVRKLHREYNVFSNMLNNYIFCTIWCATFVIQIFVVQFGSYAFSTVGLSFHQWLYCANFGIGTLTWQLLIKLLYKSMCKKLTEKDNIHDRQSRPRRSVRLDSQIRISVISDDIPDTSQSQAEDTSTRLSEKESILIPVEG